MKPFNFINYNSDNKTIEVWSFDCPVYVKEEYNKELVKAVVDGDSVILYENVSSDMRELAWEVKYTYKNSDGIYLLEKMDISLLS